MDDNLKIKIALVGCGRIASKHLEAIIDNQTHFELVAVCDQNILRAQEAGVKYHVAYFNTQAEMLAAHPEIALVSVCTPSGLHPADSIYALNQGKHVIVEKPMACKVSDAKAMLEAAEKNKKHLFVVKQLRLSPSIQAIKKAISEGAFGRIYLAQVIVFWARPQAYYDQESWRGTAELDGGAFMNQASHYVDLLTYLLGPVKSVQAMTRTLGRKIEVEDTGVVNFAWENNTLGSMSVTMLTYPKNLEGSLTLVGEKGTVTLDGANLGEVKRWYFEKNNVSPVEYSGFSTEKEYLNNHGPYYKNVSDVLTKNSIAVSDGLSGLCSLELLNAIQLSANKCTTARLGKFGIEENVGIQK